MHASNISSQQSLTPFKTPAKTLINIPANTPVNTVFNTAVNPFQSTVDCLLEY